MRSLAAIAPCITAYFAERSRMGMKNLLMYSMNTTTRPIVARSWLRWPDAHQMMRPIAM